MDLGEFLGEKAVMVDVQVASKKQLLQTLSETASEMTDLSAREIFDTILQREKLGSTGVGNGIAIPHGKFPKFDKIVGIFARLAHPIEFDALDEKPVDIIFLLLACESAGADHLKALSKIARVLRDGERLDALRTAKTSADVYGLLISQSQSNAA
ncbi:MAG: PTS IIA-like nitrogen regulatory protein PtsN [Ahrensia sp.]|nr:PTS IIA-like nitrogen regulatory protein PtsN [Ahrensia sp.]